LLFHRAQFRWVFLSLVQLALGNSDVWIRRGFCFGWGKIFVLFVSFRIKLVVLAQIKPSSRFDLFENPSAPVRAIWEAVPPALALLISVKARWLGVSLRYENFREQSAVIKSNK
jgi:hypothetical protein